MDKKGVSLGMTVIVVGIFLLIVLFAVSGAFGFGFKRVWDNVKEFWGFTDIQLEDLKQTQEAIKGDAGKEFRLYEGFSNFNEFLLDASNLIRGENERKTFSRKLKNGSKVQFIIGGNNPNKKVNYDEAIVKYLTYFEKCEVLDYSAPCTLPKDTIKFRILNVIMEKVFNAVIDKGAIPKYDSFDIKSIITEKEFGAYTSLIKVVGYTTIESYDNAQKFLNVYLQNYESDDEFISKYYAFSNGYFVMFSIIKRENLDMTDTCNSVNDYFNKIVVLVDEQESFTVSDYEFISIPSKNIDEFCGVSGFAH